MDGIPVPPHVIPLHPSYPAGVDTRGQASAVNHTRAHHEECRPPLDFKQLRPLLIGLPIMVLVLLLLVILVATRRSGSSTLSQAELTRQAITRVIKADKESGEAIQKLTPADATPARAVQAIRTYLKRANGINLSDCPAEFQVAYKQHLRAWQDMERAVNELPNDLGAAIWTGVVNAFLRGERDGGANRLEGEVRQAERRIRTTWEEVEKISARYGVAP